MGRISAKNGSLFIIFGLGFLSRLNATSMDIESEKQGFKGIVWTLQSDQERILTVINDGTAAEMKLQLWSIELNGKKNKNSVAIFKKICE